MHIFYTQLTYSLTEYHINIDIVIFCQNRKKKISDVRYRSVADVLIHSAVSEETTDMTSPIDRNHMTA